MAGRWNRSFVDRRYEDVSEGLSGTRIMKLNHPMCSKRSLSTALLVAAVVAFILMLIKITSFLEASARAQNLVKRAAAKDEPIPKNAGETMAASWAVAEQLKKDNLFSPPVPPRHPVTSVLGILGNEALIGDRWYKAGDNIADAKVVSVEPTQVRVRWQGRETIFVPMETEGQSVSGGSRPMGQDIAASQGIAAPAPGGTSSGRPPRVVVSRSPRSERALSQNRTKPTTEASKKPQISAEKLLSQKVIKQSLKAPSGKTATKKAGSAASAGKKAAAPDIKKLARQK
jgi:hypothetical protein